MVKLEDKALAKEVGVFALPSIVFFRVNAEPTIYAGDLKNEEAILEWLLVQKDPSNEAIEEQSGENLLKTIDNSEAVAVFLCKFSFIFSFFKTFSAHIPQVEINSFLKCCFIQRNYKTNPLEFPY